MRFQQTSNFSGKGQKDLNARVDALVALGESEPRRNPDHPHLWLRTDVVAAENRRGIRWFGAIGNRDAGYAPVES